MMKLKVVEKVFDTMMRHHEEDMEKLKNEHEADLEDRYLNVLDYAFEQGDFVRLLLTDVMKKLQSKLADINDERQAIAWQTGGCGELSDGASDVETIYEIAYKQCKELVA
tara:strand:+ start:513 stop:842 length:330 start_codon:yes stop_codon:yes gene_type:complete